MPRTKGAKANPLAKLTKRFDMEAGKSGLTNDELLAVKDMYEKGDSTAIAKMGIDRNYWKKLWVYLDLRLRKKFYGNVLKGLK
jgi:hypothetical protein